MEIIEVTSLEYSQIIHSPYFKYGLAEFNLLNFNKCESVYFLLFKEGKYRLGLIGGKINGIFCSPFSAPFGSFSFFKSEVRIEYLDSAVDLLIEWAKKKKFNGIKLTLPASIYDESFIAKQSNVLYRKSFAISSVALNYALNLEFFTDQYLSKIKDNARKNLKHAFKFGLNSRICDEISEKRIAFEIIKNHKEAKGYPLRMTWEEILKTTDVISTDFFLVTNSDGLPIASAIMFHVSESVVQLIYWGDVLEYKHLRTMNFLSYKLFEYYKSLDLKIVDLGPSTENSLPNYGLCEFKESIGCTVSTKFSFSIDFTEN